jgi:hypothetical protein
MFPTMVVGPFTKWGIYFTTCHLVSARGHCYIIIAVNYFTKWVEAMSTFINDEEMTTLLIFNQIVARFGISKDIVTDHGSHFHNKMMSKLTSKLWFKREHSSPYYPQESGQVEVVNNSLKTILQQTINSAKSNWDLMLYSTLWAYRILVKTANIFSPFHLVYGMEVVFPIECLDKQCAKCQYDQFIHPRVFSEGDLVLVYDQDKDPLGQASSNPCGSNCSLLRKF